MHSRIAKTRMDDPSFDKKMVDIFAEKMPKLMLVMLDGHDYDEHIGSKEVAMLAEPYIKNYKGEHIGFKWTYENIMSVAKNFIDIENQEFYPCDLFVWSNVKYGDMAHITTDPTTIIKYAISELTDHDFPYYHASKRAYCWLKKHVEHEEKH